MEKCGRERPGTHAEAVVDGRRRSGGSGMESTAGKHPGGTGGAGAQSIAGSRAGSGDDGIAASHDGAMRGHGSRSKPADGRQAVGRSGGEFAGARAEGIFWKRLEAAAAARAAANQPNTSQNQWGFGI